MGWALGRKREREKGKEEGRECPIFKGTRKKDIYLKHKQSVILT